MTRGLVSTTHRALNLPEETQIGHALRTPRNPTAGPGDLGRERGDERAHLLGVAQGLQPEERIADGLRRELLPARRNLARRQLAEMTEIPDTG